MNAHLDDSQFAQWILGERTPEAARHLAECDACRAGIENTNAYLQEYRKAVLSLGAQNPGFWTRQRQAVREGIRPRRRAAVLRWAYAATMVLIVFAAFLLTRVSPSQTHAIGSNVADDVLLQEIENDINRDYPAALAPAALLAEERNAALAAAGEASSNSATHKEQDR